MSYSIRRISYGTIAQSATDQQIVGNADNQHAQLVEDGPPAEHYDQAGEGLAQQFLLELAVEEQQPEGAGEDQQLVAQAHVAEVGEFPAAQFPQFDFERAPQQTVEAMAIPEEINSTQIQN